MAKILLIVSIAVLLVIVFQDKEEPADPNPQPIIEDLPQDFPQPEEIPEEVSEEIQAEVEALPTEEAPKKALDSIQLQGTIYGVKRPRAMFIDKNGNSFTVWQGERLLKSRFRLFRVEQNRVILERDGRYFEVKMK